LPSWPFVVIVVAMAVEATPKADAEAAPGLDPDLAVFTVQASHGYEVTIFSSRFSEELQDVAVFASSSRSTAIYRVPATVTKKSVQAEVGSLGRVAVRAVPVGRKPVLLRSCDGEGRWKIARLAYEGVIEFHGEEGFTDVEAKRAPFDYRTFREFACAGREVPRGLPMEGRPGREEREPASQAGCRISGRQDLNLRPLGPQPVDAGVIYAQARPQASPRPQPQAHREYWTMHPVPEAVPRRAYRRTTAPP
jgi:hypothetical protein